MTMNNEMSSQLEKIIEDLRCIICNETMEDPHALHCGHSYCGQCILSWLKLKTVCPICRVTITHKPTHINVLQKLADTLRHASDVPGERLKESDWSSVFPISSPVFSYRNCPRCDNTLDAVDFCIVCVSFPFGTQNESPFDESDVGLYRIGTMDDELSQDEDQLSANNGETPSVYNNNDQGDNGDDNHSTYMQNSIDNGSDPDSDYSGNYRDNYGHIINEPYGSDAPYSDVQDSDVQDSDAPESDLSENYISDGQESDNVFRCSCDRHHTHGRDVQYSDVQDSDIPDDSDDNQRFESPDDYNSDQQNGSSDEDEYQDFNAGFAPGLNFGSNSDDADEQERYISDDAQQEFNNNYSSFDEEEYTSNSYYNNDEHDHPTDFEDAPSFENFYRHEFEDENDSSSEREMYEEQYGFYENQESDVAPMDFDENDSW